MDIIASDLGFFEPLFGPMLRKTIRGGDLTFDAIESIRTEFCPDASFEATMNACVSRMHRPTIVLEARPAHKKVERELIKLRESLGPETSEPKKVLRVQKVYGNDAARAKKLHIPKNMRVPKGSIIYRCFFSDVVRAGTAVENLSSWSSSTGGPLLDRVVIVSVRCFGNRAVAIIKNKRLN